jgi:TRAP transporter 4TM/12TM fusion protein
MPQIRLKIEDVETTRYPKFNKPMQIYLMACTIIGVGAAVIHIFDIPFFDYQMVDIAYFYLIFAMFGAPVFLFLKARKADRLRIPWYDIVLTCLAFALPMFYFFNSWWIDRVGWVPPKTPVQFITAAVYVLLILEMGRRIAGWVFLGVCVVFGIYPMVADFMPGILWGKSYTIPWALSMYIYSPVGILGLPGQIMGNLLLGFLLFAAVLVATGAGEFFLNLAVALLGKYRGGPAKISVMSSAFFGTISGSAAANVVADGCFTIPTMKKCGYPAHYAGAIEACASTGGIIMPPVMGAIAFIMAAFISVPYAVVAISAVIPAILYYYGLLMGADAYAAKAGLKGLPHDELPSAKLTLKEGWPFLIAITFLTWGLLYMTWEMRAPFYASVMMILLSFTSRRTMLNWTKLVNLIAAIGKLISQAMAMILPLGIIIAGLTSTGSIIAVTNAIIQVGGENTFLLLLLGFIACYVMGMAGLGTPAYIFLAITMAPAVIKAGGLNQIAVHLFIVYISILSLISLPVAAAAFLGAAIAGSPPMKTSLTAMRLGIVVYFVPFFFVYNPALILQGNSLWESFYLFVFCLIGVTLIAGSLEGYIWGIGKIPGWARLVLIGAGFLIGAPFWLTTVIGSSIAIPVVVFLRLRRKPKPPITVSSAPT